MKYLSEFLNWQEANKIVAFADFWSDRPAEVDTLLNDYIALGNPYIVRIRKPAIFFADNTITEEDEEEAVKATWNDVKLFFTKTAPVYQTLIKLYKDNEANLMASLKDDITREDTSESNASDDNKHVESDTPVSDTIDSFAEGASDNLSFGSQDKNTNTATTTQSGTSSRTYDTTYTIDKLDKVRQKMVNLYARWYAEFYKEFAALQAECSLL